MKASTTRSALASLPLAIAACAADEQLRESLQLRERDVSVAPGRIAQRHFGRETRFETCVPPTCPVPTVKTLAVEGLTAPIAPRDPQILEPSRLPHDGALPRPDREVLHFGFASAELDDNARRAIDRALARAGSVRRIVITGHTDSVGPKDVNEALAQARAEAVRRDLLERYPMLAATLELHSQARCCDVDLEGNESSRAKHRRVELVFMRDGGAP